MDPPCLLGKGGNGKNPLDPGLPYIVGENSVPILEEEKGSVEASEISGNRDVEVTIF
jgi:hypothetical protein